MTVCVDTNVLIHARARSHPYGVLQDAFLFGSINWAFSNRMLTECREIIVSKAGANAWISMARLIELIGVSGNLILITPPLPIPCGAA